MGQVLLKRLRPAAVCGVVGLVLLLVGGAAPVHAQQALPKKPSTSDYIRHIDQQTANSEQS